MAKKFRFPKLGNLIDALEYYQHWLNTQGDPLIHVKLDLDGKVNDLEIIEGDVAQWQEYLDLTYGPGAYQLVEEPGTATLQVAVFGVPVYAVNAVLYWWEEQEQKGAGRTEMELFIGGRENIVGLHDHKEDVWASFLEYLDRMWAGTFELRTIEDPIEQMLQDLDAGLAQLIAEMEEDPFPGSFVEIGLVPIEIPDFGDDIQAAADWFRQQMQIPQRGIARPEPKYVRFNPYGVNLDSLEANLLELLKEAEADETGTDVE